MVSELAKIKYQGNEVGVLARQLDSDTVTFQYEPSFVKSGIELSPLYMPLTNNIYSFPGLEYSVYKGLPGLCADSLPDDFGNAVLNAWMAAQGKSAEHISALQRLHYIGKRGMGALTYAPAKQTVGLNASRQIHIDSLVGIAQDVVSNRSKFKLSLSARGEEDKSAMLSLMSIGTSAGGARPKAVLAFNKDFSQVRSGQTDIPEDFSHYLMKFDGVSEHNQNQETFGDPLGYSTMEYVYALMAGACGIDIMPCYLLNEGDRRHFLTQRFDRVHNQKLHIQTLNGLAHISYRNPGFYSYAELLTVARRLKLERTAAQQIFKRMVFNVVARNHDDHSKNFAFMLDQNNHWQLSPAYDLAYSYKAGSPWVNSHWMSINGKRDNFSRSDFYSFEKVSPIFNRRFIDNVLDQTIEQVSQWPKLAADNAVPGPLRVKIAKNLRLNL